MPSSHEIGDAESGRPRQSRSPGRWLVDSGIDAVDTSGAQPDRSAQITHLNPLPSVVVCEPAGSLVQGISSESTYGLLPDGVHHTVLQDEVIKKAPHASVHPSVCQSPRPCARPRQA